MRPATGAGQLEEAAVLARTVVVGVGLGALLELRLGGHDVAKGGDRGRLVGRQTGGQEVRDGDRGDDGDDRDHDHQLDQGETTLLAGHRVLPLGNSGVIRPNQRAGFVPRPDRVSRPDPAPSLGRRDRTEPGVPRTGPPGLGSRQWVRPSNPGPYRPRRLSDLERYSRKSRSRRRSLVLCGHFLGSRRIQGGRRAPESDRLDAISAAPRGPAWRPARHRSPSAPAPGGAPRPRAERPSSWFVEGLRGQAARPRPACRATPPHREGLERGQRLRCGVERGREDLDPPRPRARPARGRTRAPSPPPGQSRMTGGRLHGIEAPSGPPPRSRAHCAPEPVDLDGPADDRVVCESQRPPAAALRAVAGAPP